MTQREYMKYHQEMYDTLNKPINIGDIVVANNYYKSNVLIGEVSHFVESGRVATNMQYKQGKTSYKYNIYRFPTDIVVIKKSKKKKL